KTLAKAFLQLGLKKGDIIIKADNKDVKTFADFFDLLGNYSAGDKIELTYYRPDTDKTGTVTITLQADK
ncbi:MAG: PDZ domain-containing protein, partial [Ruminococcus sp.]|nr:PDZ domain-containing protein [Ruminococcus sp.]